MEAMMQAKSNALAARAAESYGDEIYQSLGHALASTIALLDVSPPPCDQELARKALGDLIGSIFGIVSAALCNGIMRNSRHRDHRNRGIVIAETAAS
jgi:hypothetical protein